MSGICGIYKFDGESRVEQGIIEQMNNSLKHRGGNDAKIYVNKNIGLGVRQLNTTCVLSAVELSHNEDESIWACIDGEIYNQGELINLLKSKNHKIYLPTYSQTIVHLYEEFEEGLVSHLRGTFAFALVDTKRQRVLLARDRMGEKPLYYTVNRNELIFGSEIKAILQNKNVEKEIDLKALHDYLTFNYVPSPKTIFKNIYKLPPAHILSFNNGNIKTKAYWDYKFQIESGRHEKYYADNLYELLKDSIRIRMNDNSPVGAFLSGGIDSSTVVGLSSQFLNKPLKTFSAGFEDKYFSELPYARIVANHFGTEHYEVIIKPEMVKEFHAKAIWNYDEPFADSSAIPTYFACELASKHVKVVLTGDGPDQMLAGSKNYLIEKQRSFFPLPEFIRKIILNKTVSEVDIPPLSATKKEKIMKVLKIQAMPLWQRHILRRTYGFSEDSKFKLYSDDMKRALRDKSSAQIGRMYYEKCNAQDPLSKMLYIDTKMFIPDDLMVKVDRSAMAVGIETRKPFLDFHFVDFTGRIPPILKLKGVGFIKEATQKYILKKSVEQLLPKQIMAKKKQGFEAPISVWFKKDLKDYFSQILFDSKTKSRGYFNFNYIDKIWNRHQSKDIDNSLQLWALVNFELWQRTFIDGKI